MHVTIMVAMEWNANHFHVQIAIIKVDIERSLGWFGQTLKEGVVLVHIWLFIRNNRPVVGIIQRQLQLARLEG